MELNGKVALVTGASSGIGAEIARTLGGRGAHVVLAARGREALEEVAKDVEAGGGTATVIPADLGSAEGAAALGEAVLAGPGVPDLLVNNAGAGRWRAIDENEPGESHLQMALPYLAAFELTRALVPAMIARGSGRIANMTSAAGIFYLPGANGYGTARHAMLAHTEHLRGDLRGTGVGVTLICPAEVDSPYFDNNPGSRERIPSIGRVMGTLTPAEVAEKAVRAIERDRRVAYLPWRLVPFVWMARHFPRSTRAIVDATGWQRASGDRPAAG